MSQNTGGARDMVQLWGREFNIVKNGLSEAQVVSFVNDLVKQHDLLLQRQDHLATLTKLAERTVSEADKLAHEIKEEAKAQARNEAERIIAEAQASAQSEAARVVAEAEARFQQTLKERESAAMAATSERIAKIESEAKELAEQLKAEARKTADGMIEEAQARANRIVGDAESRGRHILEQKEAEALTAASEEAKAILSRAEIEASSLLERERQRVRSEMQQFVQHLRERMVADLDGFKHQVAALASGLEDALSGGPGVPAAYLEKGSASGEKQDAFMALVSDNVEGDSTQPEWEVEVVPPIDIMKIMNVVSYLDALSEVSRTEIIPRNDRTSITIYLHRPVELLALIKALPEVSHAEEMPLPPGNGKLRKISLALAARNKVTETL